MRTTNIRRPRGFKNAVNNNARKKAIPPTGWDDLRNDTAEIAWNYMERAYKKGMKFSTFLEKFRRKFPKWKMHDIKDLFYDYKDFDFRKQFYLAPFTDCSPK
jgi:hypothetical protein